MFETCEKMFEKIEVSILNELIINYNKNSKLHIIYVDKDDYILTTSFRSERFSTTVDVSLVYS